MGENINYRATHHGRRANNIQSDLRQSLQPGFHTGDYSAQLERALQNRELRTQKVEQQLSQAREQNKDLREINKELTIRNYLLFSKFISFIKMKKQIS